MDGDVDVNDEAKVDVSANAGEAARALNRGDETEDKIPSPDLVKIRPLVTGRKGPIPNTREDVCSVERMSRSCRNTLSMTGEILSRCRRLQMHWKRDLVDVKFPNTTLPKAHHPIELVFLG